jgi:hypothetical protein
MATDAAQLAQRFRDIRQEWDLRPGEVEAQAQNKALAPIHAWLRTGMNSPEVVIRAVQVLMADPERPAIHKRTAVKQVFNQIAQAWESAGLKEQDVLILKGMLLATWPLELSEGGFALAPLLDSVWMALGSRLGKEKQLGQWRRNLATTAVEAPSPSSHSKSFDYKRLTPLGMVEVPNLDDRFNELEVTNNSRSAKLFRSQQQVLMSFANQLNATTQILNYFDNSFASLTAQTNNTTHSLNQLSEELSQPDQLNLLWWGQARYSNITRKPYRRISDATERLWWMAWESSELAIDLEVEPAACFLLETLYQLDKRVEDTKRPLKDWLAEFIAALRRIHESGQHVKAMAMNDRLENLAEEDALGLPITWARLEAANPRPSEGSLEERIRTEVAIDPETLIDLGDWAAWIFRESLLDRRLGEFGDK